MIIPKGNSKEELDKRKEIISQVYRKYFIWTGYFEMPLLLVNPSLLKKE